MRTIIPAIVGVISVGVAAPALAQDAAVSGRVRLKALAEPATAGLGVSAGGMRHNVTLDDGSPMLTLTPTAAAACAAATPGECPAPAMVTGFLPGADADGRLLIVRNGGDGPVVLAGEAPGSDPGARLDRTRVLAPGEIAVFVYDAARARWHAAGLPAARAGGAPPRR
jgi:hypothetical protein